MGSRCRTILSMAKKTNYPQRCFSAAQQFQFLRSCSIATGSGKVYSGKLTWYCKIRPTVLSREYEVVITYRLKESPKVVVLGPNLKNLAGGRKLPHVYQQDPPRLCLYVPKYQEWTAAKKIATTIVPWTYSWLSYFEDWLVTNEWKGGGLHLGS